MRRKKQLLIVIVILCLGTMIISLQKYSRKLGQRSSVTCTQHKANISLHNFQFASCITSLHNSCLKRTANSFEFQILSSGLEKNEIVKLIKDGHNPIANWSLLDSRISNIKDIHWYRVGSFFSYHPENLGHMILDAFAPFLSYVIQSLDIESVYTTHWRGSLKQQNQSWFPLRRWQQELSEGVLSQAMCPSGLQLKFVNADTFAPDLLYCSKRLDIFHQGCDSFAKSRNDRFTTRDIYPLMRNLSHIYIAAQYGSILQQKWKISNRVLLISRHSSRRRKLDGHEYITTKVRELGFDVINPNFTHNISLLEQASSIASANIIVGPFGAHEVNFLFMRPGTLYLQLVRSCNSKNNPGIVDVKNFHEVPGEIQSLWKFMANYNDIVAAVPGVKHLVVCTCTHKPIPRGWGSSNLKNFNTVSNMKILSKNLRKIERDSSEPIQIPEFLLAEMLEHMRIHRV